MTPPNIETQQDAVIIAAILRDVTGQRSQWTDGWVLDCHKRNSLNGWFKFWWTSSMQWDIDIRERITAQWVAYKLSR